MRCSFVRILAVVVIGLMLGASQSRPARAGQAVIRHDDAVEAVMKLFDFYPLVAIGEGHNMVELSELYEAILRHQDFPLRVGIVAVEFGSASHQGVIDRYVSGQDVSYDELHPVWRDLLGAGPRAVSQSVPRFFAMVRAINQDLPASQHIRVLGGQAPFDFDRDYSRAEFFPAMLNRDAFFAGLVIDEVLTRGRKALIIAGANHLIREAPVIPAGVPVPNLPPVLMREVEQRFPGSSYVLQTHDGFFGEDCNDAIERLFAGAGPPVAADVQGTALGSLLLDPGCDPILPIITPGPGPGGGDVPFPGGGDVSAPAPNLAALGAARPRAERHWADGYLFLGTRDALRLSPLDPMLYLDLALFEEQLRRLRITFGDLATLEWADLLEPEPLSYFDKFFRPPPP